MKKFVLKPGSFEEKKAGQKQPGLDLSRTVLDTLVDKGILTTEDCCAYEVLNSASDFMARMNSIQVVTDDVTLDGTIGTTIVDNVAATVDITFPTVVGNSGMRLTIARGDSNSTGAINIFTVNSEDIQDPSTGELSNSPPSMGDVDAYLGRVTFQTDGISWYYIG